MLQIEWTDATGGTQLLAFDAVVRETYEGTAEITEHAVESGAAISDHVRAGNDTLSLEAIVTNHPIVVPGTAMGGAAGGTDPLTLRLTGGRTATVNVLQWTEAFDRVRAVDEILRGLAGKLLTVRTNLRVYEDVAIARYKVERDAPNGNALALNLDLKRLRVASTERVAVPDPAQRRGRRAQNRGAQPAVPWQPPASAAFNLLSPIFGWRRSGQ